MRIDALYQKGKHITVICPDFNSTVTSWQKLQQMLESKKFQLLPDELAWQRREFGEDSTESFDFWLSQVTKLCNKYGGNEPIGYEENSNKNEPAKDEEMSADSSLKNQCAFIPDNIVTQSQTEEGRRKEGEITSHPPSPFPRTSSFANKNEPTDSEEISADSLVAIHQGASTAYVAIVAQLSELREEIAQLKKFDSAANEKLRLLREKAEGRRQKAGGK